MYDKLINIIESPMKSLIATLTGTITGYIPMVANNLTNFTNTKLDTMFQHTVWTITIIVGITSLITWCQKQRKQWLENHKNKHNSLYDINEEED